MEKTLQFGFLHCFILSSKSWELYFRCLTSMNCYPLSRLTHRCETKDKVITLGPNELPNLAQYIRTTLKQHKKLSHIEENDLPRDDPKFEA
ncbi:hypothetical protein CR513_05314, partial [Mucuna pruriens]